MDGSHIREVKADGIEYVDVEGNIKFIDFANCYENYVEKHTTRDYWERHKELNKLTEDDFPRHVERVKAWKEVGERQILGPPLDDGPYVVFHTEPPIRFDLTEDQYGLVVGMIRKFGWHTFDLS